MIIRARCIQPIGQAPLDNGALVLRQGLIKWIGPWRDCPETGRMKVHDLGEVVVLPGLINAHCHLDFTHMAGKIPPPKLFPDWVKTMLSLKAHWGYSEFAESWLAGASMLLKSGVTTVCDVESYPELLPEAWNGTPLKVFSFLEMTGVKDQRQANAVLEESLAHIKRLQPEASREVGLSPHAPYSTTPELMRESAAAAAELNLRLTTHVAESEAEFLMFTERAGPFHDWLKHQRLMSDCGRGSPVQLLHDYQILGPRFLAVHVNYLAPGDAQLLARSGTSVVHCPRSHEYFGHQPFPFGELEASGVNLCLGTDSLATTLKLRGQEPALDLWEEMRAFASKNPGVRPRTIFEMVTLNPARALGKTGELAQLKANTPADFIALNYTGKLLEGRIYETLLHQNDLRELFIDGMGDWEFH